MRKKGRLNCDNLELLWLGEISDAWKPRGERHCGSSSGIQHAPLAGRAGACRGTATDQDRTNVCEDLRGMKYGKCFFAVATT